MQLETFAIDDLHPHPQNSNVMPEAMLTKLAGHLEATDRYPPVIVRPLPGHAGAYQVLDGHHRVAALRRIGRDAVRCVVWDVDDAGALLLLATLNRLQGHDDPRKRAALVNRLREHADLKQLARALPEDGGRLKKLMRLNDAVALPRAPQAMDDMPVSLHFFLRPAERSAVERRLAEVGPTRERALLSLLGVEHQKD